LIERTFPDAIANLLEIVSRLLKGIVVNFYLVAVVNLKILGVSYTYLV